MCDRLLNARYCTKSALRTQATCRPSPQTKEDSPVDSRRRLRSFRWRPLRNHATTSCNYLSWTHRKENKNEHPKSNATRRSPRINDGIYARHIGGGMQGRSLPDALAQMAAKSESGNTLDNVEQLFREAVLSCSGRFPVSSPMAARRSAWRSSRSTRESGDVTSAANCPQFKAPDAHSLVVPSTTSASR